MIVTFTEAENGDVQILDGLSGEQLILTNDEAREVCAKLIGLLNTEQS